MRLYIASLLAAGLTAVSAQSQATCPTADGLFFVAASQTAFEIECGFEYYTDTNLASYPVTDMFACAT